MKFNVNEPVVKMLEIIANRKELRTLIYTAMSLLFFLGALQAMPDLLIIIREW